MVVLSWVFGLSIAAWLLTEVVMLIRQFRRGERARTTEWRSLAVIWVCAAVGGVLAGQLVQHLPSARIAIPKSALLAIGLILLWCGVGFRLWAIHTLGKYFRVVVHLQPDHHVVSTGPYRYLRHPSYTGLLVALVAAEFTAGNWAALLVYIGFVFAGVRYRIQVEERVLLEGLGAEYADYAASTKRLIPGVW
jgi:protein-S-isoprenylcysteine O-methyltransferase Ste14